MNTDRLIRETQTKVWQDLQEIVDAFVQSFLEQVHNDLIDALQESWTAHRVTKPRRQRPAVRIAAPENTTPCPPAIDPKDASGVELVQPAPIPDAQPDSTSTPTTTPPSDDSPTISASPAPKRIRMRRPRTSPPATIPIPPLGPDTVTVHMSPAERRDLILARAAARSA